MARPTIETVNFPNLGHSKCQHCEGQCYFAWEIAKLVENSRLSLNCPVLDWINAALTHPKVQLVPLTPDVIVQSTQLPGIFHKDPADQLIVATSIHLGIPLLTKDAKILGYAHVSTIA